MTMRPSQRTNILDAALRLLQNPDGGDLTLDGVAREAGMSKPGLMYHFPTREALMLAVVDHAAAGFVATMEAALGTPREKASPAERIAAYAAAAAQGETSRGEYAIYSEAAYRPDLAGPWLDRVGPWLELPDDVDPDTRTRLTVARLAADGLWAALATGVFAPEGGDLDAVVTRIRSLATTTSCRSTT